MVTDKLVTFHFLIGGNESMFKFGHQIGKISLAALAGTVIILSNTEEASAKDTYLGQANTLEYQNYWLSRKNGLKASQLTNATEVCRWKYSGYSNNLFQNVYGRSSSNRNTVNCWLWSLW